MSAGTGPHTVLATSELARAIDELRAEVVASRNDAKRAIGRDFRLLGADLYARAARLERLAATLAGLLKDAA